MVAGRKAILMIGVLVFLASSALAEREAYAIHVDVEQKHLTLFRGDAVVKT